MKEIIRIFAANEDTPTIPSVLPKKVNEEGAGDLQTTVIGVINGIIGALSLVAVIIIILGGIGYMTSSGDAGKVKKAKDTILYGVIGLVICVLAFAIVNFVIVNLFGTATTD